MCPTFADGRNSAFLGYADILCSARIRFLKPLRGRNPETDPDLASQPALSRLENGMIPKLYDEDSVLEHRPSPQTLA